jgi:hypothetical protein
LNDGDTPPFAAAIAAAVERAEREDIDEQTLPSLCALDVETERCIAMVGRWNPFRLVLYSRDRELPFLLEGERDRAEEGATVTSAPLEFERWMVTPASERPLCDPPRRATGLDAMTPTVKLDLAFVARNRERTRRSRLAGRVTAEAGAW